MRREGASRVQTFYALLGEAAHCIKLALDDIVAAFQLI